MLNRTREQAVWERVCAHGGRKPDLQLLHGRPEKRSGEGGLTPLLQLLTLLRLLVHTS